MLIQLKQKWKAYCFYKEWRKRNPHNSTTPVSEFSMDCVEVGIYTYGGLNILNFGCKEKLKIGNFCSIAPGVTFILNADHPVNHISTFPFKVKCTHTAVLEGISKGDIVIEDDVWIGYNATILSGVTIGQGAIIAAGAVITKNIPPYAIAAGVPAKVVKYRFDQEICKLLQKVDYSKLDKRMIEEHIDQLYEPVIKKDQVEWLPPKD